MNSRRWIVYSLLRIGLFAVALVVLMLLGLELWLAAIIATIIAFAVSYIFLRDRRDELALSLQNRRETHDDGEAEDAALDAAPTDAAVKNEAVAPSAPRPEDGPAGR